MNGITLQNAALTAVRMQSQRPAAQPQLDQEIAKRLEQTREQAAQASKTLDTSKTEATEQRRTAAKEKLDLIRKALRMIKMIGGDPKSMAIEGARLARQLAAAIKEYAAAGGKDAAAPAPAGPSTAPVPAPSKAAGGAAPEEAAAESAVEGGGATPPAPEAALTEEGDGTTPADPDAEAAKEGEADVTGSDVPDDFADQARALAKKLRAFLNRQVEQLKDQPTEGSERVGKEVSAALDELRRAEGALPSASAGLSSPLDSLDILI